jgi:2-polyprenyl-6-methoxyphenol hydroxylase-like FAD-dependent oxidoreductase
MRIRIVGGSLGGLFAGILLHNQGFDVRIYERSGADLKGRGAGLTGGPELFDGLRLIGCDDVGRIGVASNRQVVLDRKGRIIADRPSGGMRFSWDVLYRAARAKLPDQRYLQSRHVDRVEDGHDEATIHFRDGTAEHADLVIGADGIASVVRRAVEPERYANKYAGYTGWRIFIPERDLPKVLAPWSEALVAFTEPGSQSIGYMTPGPDGETALGERRYSWGWYRPISEELLSDLYTDVQGHHFDYSLPPDGMSEGRRVSFWADVAAALPPQFAALSETGAKPWVQGIYDYMPTRIVGRRLALIGDAAALARPHVGAGTSKAAGDAIALARVIQRADTMDQTLAEYQDERLPLAKRMVERSREIGASLGLETQLRRPQRDAMK